MTVHTIQLSTTGTLATVVIDSLGKAQFIHPVVSLDLFEEFDKDVIIRNDDVIAELNLAVANGFITLTDTSDGSNVTDVAAANLVAYGDINGAPNLGDVNNAIANSHDAATALNDSVVVGGTGQQINVNLDTTTNGGDNAIVLTPGEGLYVAPSAGINDTDDVPEGAVNLYYTEARVSANTDVAANTAARHDAATALDDSIIVGGTGQQLNVNIDTVTPDNQLVLTAGEGLYVPPAVVKYTWCWDVFIDANTNANRRAMDRGKGMPTTDSPFYAPTACDITRVVASNRDLDANDIAEVWNFVIEVNDVVAYTLAVTALDNVATDLAVGVSLAAGDKVTMFFEENGTGRVRYPAASVYLIDQ